MSETALIVGEQPPQEVVWRQYMPDPNMARAAMERLQEIMQAVLDENDYAVIEGKKWRKRSAFTKLRRAFSVSLIDLQEEWEELPNDAFGCRFTVRATFPDGRYEDGDGYCDSSEFERGRMRPTRHNVRSKAHTRAKNRATADLLGTGEVSAEELGPETYSETRDGKCPVCGAAHGHAPWCKVVDGERVDTRQARNPGPDWEEGTFQAGEDGDGGQPQAVPQRDDRPADPEKVRYWIRAKSQVWVKAGPNDPYYANAMREEARLVPATEKQISAVASLMNDALRTDHDDDQQVNHKRHAVLNYLVGVQSTKGLSKQEASAVITWLRNGNEDWTVSADSAEEARRIWRQFQENVGQTTLDGLD